MSKHIDEERLNEYRMLHLASDTVIPIIDELHNNAYDTLMMKYREGDKDLLPIVARLEAYTAIKEDLINKTKLYEKYASKGDT